MALCSIKNMITDNAGRIIKGLKGKNNHESTPVKYSLI